MFLNRLAHFRSRVANIFATRVQDTDEIFLADLLELVNEGLPTTSLYGTAEATQICQEMEEKNELMISNGIVYRI